MNSENSSGINFSNKVGFIVGFSAVIIALYPYQGFAKDHGILLFSRYFSFFTLTEWFLLFLFASTYMYGLNYIRYDFPFLLNIRLLRFIEILAHLIYSAAFAFPFLVLLIWTLSLLFSLIPIIPVQVWSYLLNGVAIFYSVGAFVVSLIYYKTKQKNITDQLKEETAQLSANLKLSNRDADIPYKILSLYEIIISELKSSLAIKIGIDISRIPSFRLALTAMENKIINSKDYALIQDLRALRNKVAHNIDISHASSENLQNLILQAENLLKKLGEED